MPAWKALREELSAEAAQEKWVVNNRIALSKYYQVAKNKWEELEALFAARDWRGVYVSAKKFMTLTNDAMPKHKNYAKSSLAAKRDQLLVLKRAAIEYLEKAAGELEYLCDTTPDASPASPTSAGGGVGVVQNTPTSSVAVRGAARHAAQTRQQKQHQHHQQRQQHQHPAAVVVEQAAASDEDPELAALRARLMGLDTNDDAPAAAPAAAPAPTPAPAPLMRSSGHSRGAAQQPPVQRYVTRVVPGSSSPPVAAAQPVHIATAVPGAQWSASPVVAAAAVASPAPAPTSRDLARLAHQTGGWGGVGSAPAPAAVAPALPQASYSAAPTNMARATAVRVGGGGQGGRGIAAGAVAAAAVVPPAGYSSSRLADLAQRHGKWRGVNLSPIIFRARARPVDDHSFFDKAGAPATGAGGAGAHHGSGAVGAGGGLVRVQARPTKKNYDHIHPDLRKHAIDQDFLRELAASGAQVVQCAKDGNCLFRAISCQLYGTPDLHPQVRRQAVDYMRSQPERFKWLVEPPTAAQLEVYLRARERPVTGLVGEWGDHPEILALEEVFDRPIEIYSHENGARMPRKTHMTELPDALKSVTPFRLTFHGDNHYNAVNMHRPGDRERVPLALRHSRHLQAFRTSE